MREVSLRHTELEELSTEILEQGGSLRFKAHGYSMSPFIRDGDVLTTQSIESADLEVGDVALYRSAGNRLVAHRVVGKRKENGRLTLVMRGDSQSGSTELVYADQILGRVVSIQRGDKVFLMNRNALRLAAILWGKSSPYGPWLMRLAGKTKRAALGLLHR
jgi:signal peptidase